MAGVEVSGAAAVPTDLEVREIPAQNHLLFRWPVGPDPFQPQSVPAIQEIWGRRVPASGQRPSGGPDFELYPAGLEPGVNSGWMEYWMPVQG